MTAVNVPIDQYAAGYVMRLSDYVRMARGKAADAAWSGDITKARFWDRDADEAIKAGLDHVPMF